MTKKTLVLGASLKSIRYSHMAVRKLVKYNHEVYPVGLKTGEIDGIVVDTFDTAFAKSSLGDLPAGRQGSRLEEEQSGKAEKGTSQFHTITLYLSPKRQSDYYEYILALKPQRVIFNPGTENPELYKLLDENGIAYEIACTLVLLSTDQY